MSELHDNARALLALRDDATPGPWLYRGKSNSLHRPPPAGTPYTYGDFVVTIGSDDNPNERWQDLDFLAAAHEMADTIAGLLAENERLQRESIKSERRAIAFGDVIQSHVIAMRAAVVAAANESPGRGIEWIQNTLRGPGHLPNIEIETSAQGLWDRENAEHETFRARHPAPETQR